MIGDKPTLLDQMRGKRSVYNIIATLVLQFVNIVTSLIVPGLIIRNYGSDVNGLIVSITQFLNYISLLDGGTGGVIKAALYPSIAVKDKERTSSILNATKLFFRKIAFAFIIYTILLCIFYPKLITGGFSSEFIITMIVIIAISNFSQYFLGISNQLLLQADQKSYVVDTIQIIVVLCSTIATIFLIHIKASIHLVKFASIIILAIKAIVMYAIVKTKYDINYKSSPDMTAISQRWDGLGQHIAYFIHTNTDVVILTVFSAVSNVSVYSIYALVCSGLRNIIYAFTNGCSAALGNMLALNEKEKTDKVYNILETANTIFTFSFFGTAVFSILSFVKLYTKGVNDADYIQPLFATIILLAEAMYCLRFPLVTITNVAGHYKQTRNGAFIEAGTNILVSLALVSRLGLVGVAIGTLCGMTYRTLDYIRYLKNNIIYHKPLQFFKTCLITLVGIVICYPIVVLLNFSKSPSFIIWSLKSFSLCITFMAVSFIAHYIFNRNAVKDFIKMVKNIIR